MYCITSFVFVLKAMRIVALEAVVVGGWLVMLEAAARAALTDMVMKFV